MTSLSQAAGLPAPKTFGALTLNFGRVNLRVVAKFEAWCRDRVIERAKKSLAGLPADLQAEVMREAVRESNRCSLASPLGSQMARSMEGAAMLVFLAAEPYTPNLTFDAVMDNIGLDDQESLDAAVEEALGIKKPPANPT